jgi:hypothetical protein
LTNADHRKSRSQADFWNPTGLRGLAGDALLDSYEAERRPAGTASVLRSLRHGPEPSADGVVEDLGVRYPSGEQRAPHAWVRHAGRWVSTIDLFDARLTLLTGAHGAYWRRPAAELAAAELPITALSVGPCSCGARCDVGLIMPFLMCAHPAEIRGNPVTLRWGRSSGRSVSEAEAGPSSW